MNYNAKKPLFKEFIVFIPWYGAKIKSLKAHVDFVNSLGFNASVIPLTWVNKRLPGNITGLKKLKTGMIGYWEKQINNGLDKIDGDKIVFCFSMPSFSVFQALYQKKRKDIAGIVCDGGPFSGLGFKISWGYFTHVAHVPNKLLRLAVSIISFYSFGRNFEKHIFTHINSLPENFPVLSVRGLKDPMVPPSFIDNAFKQQKHLDLYTLALPDGVHLNGLHNFSDIYKPKIEEFLSQIATPAK
ncbi:MAG: hypothetical protein K8F52_04425 [Candidatus Scalindua rubra]|uniref:Alpha/beta hydrolase family protein n=1 Tax=Candidatus Scalindua brodae TaxID=237368 RepID=A0A0B0EHV3_9BACT|nr:MAG: hypothetical protein SCABRO_02104 [Candidatus Scalindua brodae]MBZ0107891.1 hypothetical protein [Candidatus Scalindua rubra]